MRNLPPLNIRYPFDPTGKNPDNLVRDELRQLPLVNKRILVPTMGAFYTDSLRVRNLERELVKGKDYELVMLYHDATVETGKEVNIGIYFSNLDIIGEVYLTYQVVGGQFTGVWEAVQQYVNVLLVDPRQVRWDDVLNKPDFYVPKEHFHDINDVYGLNALIPFIEEIRDAIFKVRKDGLVRFNHRLFDYRNNLETIIDGLRDNLNNNKDEVKSIVENIKLLKTSLDGLDTELDNLDNKHIGKYNELKRLVDTISPKVDNLVERVDTIESGLSELEGKVNKNIEKLTQHEQVHGTINQSITNLDNKYNNITSGLTSKVDNLLPRVVEEETKSTQFKNKLDNHEGRITDLENKRTEDRRELTELINNANNEDITNLQQQVTSNTQNIESSNQKIKANETNITDLTDKYNNIINENNYIKNERIPIYRNFNNLVRKRKHPNYTGINEKFEDGLLVLDPNHLERNYKILDIYVDPVDGVDKMIEGYGYDDDTGETFLKDIRKETPFKTIAGAIEGIPSYFKNIYIHLNKDNQEYVIDEPINIINRAVWVKTNKSGTKITIKNKKNDFFNPSSNILPDNNYNDSVINLKDSAHLKLNADEIEIDIRIPSNTSTSIEVYDRYSAIYDITKDCTLSIGTRKLNIINNGSSLVSYVKHLYLSRRLFENGPDSIVGEGKILSDKSYPITNTIIVMSYNNIKNNSVYKFTEKSSWDLFKKYLPRYRKTKYSLDGQYTTNVDLSGLDFAEGEEDFKIIEKGLDKGFFEHSTNDPKKYKQSNGFISGTAHSDDIKKLRFITPKKVGEVDFRGFNIVHDNGNVASFLSFGEYDHYISSFNKNSNTLNNEKIVTDWGLMNDPKIQMALHNTIINESRIKYVDSVNGDDDTGDGTWRKPFRTFLKAFDELKPSNKGGVIRLAEGQTHTVTNKRASDWLMCRMQLPLLVIESYGPRSNQRIGYQGTVNNPYTNKIWNGFTSYQDNGIETILLFVNGSNQDRSNYIFDGYYNKYMIYFMGIHVKLDQNADRDTYGKGLSLAGVVGDAYIYSYLSRFSLLKEHTYLLTKSYTGRENGIYFEEFRNNQGQVELSVRGLGKIFKPDITSNINDDNQYNYNGLNIHTDHPSLYTDEILERYIPKLKHGKLTWNSNVNTNISRSNKLDPSLLPVSKNKGNLLSVRDDGIYYGIEAPPNTSVVYVDAENGDDNNPGTKAEPFRTLIKAWDLDIESGFRTILLKEGQRHVTSSKTLTVKGNVTRRIHQYGPITDELYRNNYGWYGDSHKDLTKPGTRLVHISEKKWKDPKSKLIYIDDRLFTAPQDGSLRLEIKGIIIEKHSNKYINKVINRTVEDGYTWTYSHAKGWGYHNDGKVDFVFFNCKIEFVNNWTETDTFKYKDYNILINGRNDTVVDFIGTRSGFITGEGRFFNLVFPNTTIKSSNSLSDEELRKYFYNVKNTAIGLDNLNTDNNIRVKRALYLNSELLRVNRKIIFEDADQTFKVYYGSQESTYTTGELQFSYTTNKFKFTKPVMNERNQVLGISAASGNLLTLRDDGFYYGIEAPPDLSNLYVSPTGNDRNPGTKESPLRTIIAAMNKTPSGSKSTIWLFPGTYDWPDWLARPENKYDIKAYVTEPNWINHPQAPYFRPFIARDYPRPTIRVRKIIKHSGSIDYVWRLRVYVDEINITGIHFILDDNNPTGNNVGSLNGSIPGFINAKYCRMFGCILDIQGDPNKNNPGPNKYRRDSWLRVNNLILNAVDIRGLHKHNPDQSNKLYSTLLHGPSLPNVALLSYRVARTDIPGYNQPDDIPITTLNEMKSKFNYHNICNQIEFDLQKQVVYGININMNLFSNEGATIISGPNLSGISSSSNINIETVN